MTGIRVDDLHKNWMKDAQYRREYEALEEEFSLVSALIAASTRDESKDLPSCKSE